jgi:Holin of 3TMs, for gene-transfer release
MDADQAKADLFKSVLSALAVSDAAQNEVNKIEAASASFFVAGWRPFIGWMCGLGLCYQFLVWPFLKWFADLLTVAGPPLLDGNSLMSLLTGMLGLSASRSYEKSSGVETTTIAPVNFKLPSLSALKGGK